jgi:beta-phosphoglucomutase
MPLPRAVLWDLDGTLVDSEEAHWLAWQETLSAAGVRISQAQFKATFGQRNESFLPGWLGVGADDPKVAQTGADKEAAFRRLVRAGRCSWMPGAREWVERLGRGGWLQAIASSAPRANVETVLGYFAMAARFRAVVAAEDVQEGKPDPQVFLETASRLAIAPARCIVVEDAPAGIEAARRAGMKSIGVNIGTALPGTRSARSLVDLSAATFDSLLPA